MYKILLADDESIENEALKTIITERIKEAVVVGMASLGEEAVNLNQKFDPDLIFMGVMMPGMTGLEAAEQIKKENKDRKIIMISSSDRFDFIQKALRLKVEDYLLKPIHPENLIEILKYHMDTDRKEKMEKQKNEIIDCFRNYDYSRIHDLLWKVTRYFESLPLKESVSFSKSLFSIMQEMKMEETEQEKKEIGSIWDLCKTPKEIQQVLIEETENLIQDMPYRRKSSMQGDSLKVALNYIEKNFRNNIMLQDVAEELNFSNAYLSKRFKKDLGTNFNKYLTQRRMEEAKKMLTHSKTSINEIAFEIGYNEPNYFCKVFKKSEGITPSEYREKNKIFIDG